MLVEFIVGVVVSVPFTPLRFAHEDNLQCTNKLYESKYILSCEHHSLSDQIEHETRFSNAHTVIHSLMGHGHSKVCEAAFNVQV